jgi:chromosome segregation ATPase
MTVLLKSGASRTFHDFNVIQSHIQSRAVAAVEEQLRVLVARLSQLGGTADDHRLTAYSQLLSALTHDVETAVFNVDRRAVTNLRNDQIAAKVEAEQQLHVFNERLARKEQTILSLQAEQANMDFKNKSLIRTVELLSKELEKCNSSLSDLHQRAVEFRMQALDFKAEVDKRAQRVQQSVQARVGFVPETIQKHINQLTALLVSLLVFLCYRGLVRYAVAIACFRSRSLLL